jgi:hypothetical protein
MNELGLCAPSSCEASHPVRVIAGEQNEIGFEDVPFRDGARITHPSYPELELALEHTRRTALGTK